MFINLQSFIFMFIWVSEFCLNSISTAKLSLTTLARSAHFFLQTPKAVSIDQLLTCISGKSLEVKGYILYFFNTNVECEN